MFQILKKAWYSCVSPETIDFERHIGNSFWVKDVTGYEVCVVAERIIGSKAKGRANMLEVWSRGNQFQLPIIDFYAQLDGKRASAEELQHFEDLARSADVRVNRNWRPSWAQGAGKLWTPPNRKN